jgi:hypothetical protein
MLHFPNSIIVFLLYFTLTLAKIAISPLFFPGLSVWDSDKTVAITNRTDYFTLF